jgi:hypothetical protein
MAAVPVSAGAVHVTVADASPAVAETPVGAAGAAGVTGVGVVSGGVGAGVVSGGVVGAVVVSGVVCDVSMTGGVEGDSTELEESPLHATANATKATEATPQIPLCLERSTELPFP